MTDTNIYIEVPSFWLNQSRWKMYQDCDRLYAWFEIENLEPAKLRRPLEIGSAIHDAMVAANTHESPGSNEAFTAAGEAAKERLKQRWAGQPKLPGDEAAVLDDMELVKRMMPAYWRHYQHIGALWKPLGQEVAFCVEVGEGTGVYLVGRLDNLVVFMGRLWIVDYKTMGRLDMRDFLKYEIDLQPTAYIYGGTKQLSIAAKAEGKPPVMIAGIIIDGLVKTQVPQFHREMFTRSVEDLREFELEFCMKAWEIASKHAAVKGDRGLYNYYRDRMYDLGQQGGWKVIFPKNTQQCFRYGACSMRDLCVKDTDVRRMAYNKRTLDYVDEAAGRGKAER